MMEAKPGRAHRVAVSASVPAETRTTTPDYASAFELATSDAGRHSAQKWARITFQDAPRALRWFILFGWTAVLRLRLGPASSADHVLGWRIAATTFDTVVLEVTSPLVAACKVVQVGQSGVTMTTFVRFERRLGRLIWTALAPVHHLTEPLLLTLAARSGDQRASRRNLGA